MSTQIKYDILVYKLGFKPSNNFLFEGLHWSNVGHRNIYQWTNNLRPQDSFDIDKTISLPINETAAYTNLANVDYMRIRITKSESWTASEEWDYFIIKVERIANDTIRYTLRLDTLNTFSGIVLSHLTAKTMILREHKDRFYKPNGYVASFPISVNVLNRIDDMSESINPKLFQTSSQMIQSSLYQTIKSWYLIYMTDKNLSEDNAGNPVSCYLCSDDKLLWKKESSGAVVTWTADSLADNSYYYITYEDNGNAEVTIDGTTYTLGTANYLGVYLRGFYFHLDGGNLKWGIWTSKELTSPDITFSSGTESEANNVVLTAVRKYRQGTFFTNQLSIIHAMSLTEINSGTSGAMYTADLTAVNRSDSRLIKIIKLPYCPIDLSKNDDGEYSFGNDFAYDGGLMKLKSDKIDKSFLCAQLTSVKLTEFVTSIGVYDLAGAYLTERYIVDPKIYHSDFHTLKFTYDSFSIYRACEKITPTGSGDIPPEFYFAFKPTNTINSNFMFKALCYYGVYAQAQDFDVLLSSRNNEVTIFNNAYINYIKTGYNYDKKAKTLESQTRWTSFGLTLAGSIGAAAVSAGTLNPIGAAAAVSGFFSAANQLQSAIASEASSENSLQAKIAGLRAQSTSVAGVDDIDLLNYYSDNKLWCYRYDPSTKISGMLKDLFYYYGYACGYQGVPDWTSRLWFNFVQCEPVFDIATTSTILPVYLDDLRARLKEGVTCMHWNDVNTRGTEDDYYNNYDWNQTRENWEKWILGK